MKLKLTLRVYVFLRNPKNEILLLDEKSEEHRFTKLPGGGLELGEGVIDCLKRELKEELNIENLILEQLYVSESFIASKLHENTQVVAVYYQGDLNHTSIRFNENETNLLNHHWIPIKELTRNHFTFEMDKHALKKYLSQQKI